MQVDEGFLAHEKLFADAPAGRAELESVAAPAAVKKEPSHRRPVDDRVVVGGVVVSARPLVDDADALQRRYPLKDARSHPFEELRAVPGLYRMRLILVVAAEKERPVRALLEVGAVVEAEDHRTLKDFDGLCDEAVMALRIDRQIHSYSLCERGRPRPA